MPACRLCHKGSQSLLWLKMVLPEQDIIPIFRRVLASFGGIVIMMPILIYKLFIWEQLENSYLETKPMREKRVNQKLDIWVLDNNSKNVLKRWGNMQNLMIILCRLCIIILHIVTVMKKAPCGYMTAATLTWISGWKTHSNSSEIFTRYSYGTSLKPLYHLFTKLGVHICSAGLWQHPVCNFCCQQKQQN